MTPIWPAAALVNVLLLCALATASVAVWVLWGLDGWGYYTTPLRVRGYHHAHALLKPSGSVAHWCGVCGVSMMLVPIAYQVRKRWMRLRVVREDGRPVRFFEVFVRNLLRLVVDFMPAPTYALGVISIIFSARSKRIGDFVAGTVVVKERATEAPSLDQIIKISAIEQERVERQHILSVLETSRWRISGAGGAAAVWASPRRR